MIYFISFKNQAKTENIFENDDRDLLRDLIFWFYVLE